MNTASHNLMRNYQAMASVPVTSVNQLLPLALSQASIPNMATLSTLANVAQFKMATPSQPIAINLALQNASSALNHHHGQNKHKPMVKKGPKKMTTQNCSCCCGADKPFVCDWVNCGKRFRQKPHLDAHRNIHTGRRFICEWPTCGKSFVRKYNLTEHQKLHRDANPNMCTYPDCGKVFSSRYCLVRHQNAQHNLNL